MEFLRGSMFLWSAAPRRCFATSVSLSSSRPCARCVPCAGPVIEPYISSFVRAGACHPTARSEKPRASRRNRATDDNCVSYRRMKTLHLDTRPDWRGGQHQILLTMRGLRHLGHDAQLLTRANSLLAQRASAENFSVHRFSTRFPRLQALLCLNEILHQQRFEIIHAHDPHALTAAWLARAHHRAALAVSRRVAYPLSRFWLGLARYRAAHRIIAVSKFVADSVISSGIDSERVAVVYDGAEIPAPFTPYE